MRGRQGFEPETLALNLFPQTQDCPGLLIGAPGWNRTIHLFFIREALYH